MKLKIWQDEEGRRRTSIDGIEFPITGLDLRNRPHHPSEVTLHLLAEEIDIETDANVEFVSGNNTYHLKAIKTTTS